MNLQNMNNVIMVKLAVHLYETPASYVLWCVSKIVQKPSDEIILSSTSIHSMLPIIRIVLLIVMSIFSTSFIATFIGASATNGA